MTFKSMRRLVTGSGTVSRAAGSRLATFSVDQDLKRGALIEYFSPFVYYTSTIRGGAGKVWECDQTGSGHSNMTFRTSDPGTSRVRGATNNPGGLPAGNKLFLYLSRVDSNGNPDMYLYYDTLWPEHGVHPYTRDQWTGSHALTSYPQDSQANPVPAILIDSAVRIRNLDGRVSALEGVPVPEGTSDPWRY